MSDPVTDDDLPSSVGILDAAPAYGADAAYGLPPDAFDEPDLPEVEAPAPPVGDEGDRETLAECAGLEQNDTDNGRRMLLHFGDELQHVREVGWHTWSGKLWRRKGGDEAATTYAQRTAKRIHAEVPFLEHLPHEATLIASAEPLRLKQRKDLTAPELDALAAADEAIKSLKGRRRSLHKHATTSGNASRVSAMISQALPHKSAAPEEVDADPMLLNVENGTLRFSKVEDPDLAGEQPAYCLKTELLDHDRAHLITKMAPVVYDPKATCPKFMAFMEWAQPDETVRRYMQTYHGLALTGLADHQCFVFNFGGGANGKSTFMQGIAELLGSYANTLNAESLTGQGQRRGDQATPDFADLPGARYLRVSELPRGEPLKEALVKALTGGEPMKVRHLNKGFFDLIPVFKAAMSGNDKPGIGGVDNGIWRRMKLIVWPASLAREDQRPMGEIMAEFAAERSGILNWLIAGLDRYFREGLVEPGSVTEATSTYRDEMDPIGAFIKACVIAEDGHFVTARDMYLAFARFCDANSIRPWKETMFGRVFPQKGFEREMGRVRRYLNVRLEMGDIPMRDPRAPVGGGDHES